MNKGEVELASFLPKLKKYDGIKALKKSRYLFQIPSEASVEIGKVLYEATGKETYLNIIKRNIDASPDTISLSEEFFDGAKISIDAEVKVLYQENDKDIIGQYIIFSKVYNEQRKLYGNTKMITKN